MFGSRDEAWLADRARVKERRAFFREQSLWVIWTYRFGQRVQARKKGIRKFLQNVWYKMLAQIVETLTGIRMPQSCKIGKGLRIWHFGGIFINANAVIGENCTLRQGVTIGNRHNGDEAPTIGDNVEIGAYAQILGDVRIGNNCKIGALTLVIEDMPDDATAVGQKARIILRREQTD
jgi:serine O-acetyltransferase